MGYLLYGNSAEYEFDDRVLAHLKACIGAKLRRKESFFLSWANPTERGSGRLSLWVSPNIPLIFRFAGNRPAELNRMWVDVMLESSHSVRGLIVMSEKDAETIFADRAEHIRE